MGKPKKDAQTFLQVVMRCVCDVDYLRDCAGEEFL